MSVTVIVMPTNQFIFIPLLSSPSHLSHIHISHTVQHCNQIIILQWWWWKYGPSNQLQFIEEEGDNKEQFINRGCIITRTTSLYVHIVSGTPWQLPRVYTCASYIYFYLHIISLSHHHLVSASRWTSISSSGVRDTRRSGMCERRKSGATP